MQTTVLGTRLTDAERVQVVAAAKRLGLTLSQFARQSVLASSAQVERKASVKANPEAPERESRILLLDQERGAHHFVEGQCLYCGIDVDGQDLPCTAPVVG